MDGLLVIDKPAGMTSRDVVNIAQRWFPRGTRLGHTGTLDPLATGVLVLCVGKATKFADRIQALGKSYRTRILLGATSDTDDVDGQVVLQTDARPATIEAIRSALPSFVGSIDQLPPAYSAVKVGGRRAYALARRGKDVPLQPRRVRVDAVEILDYVWPRLDLAIDCGKGTYIRSIARDLGAALGAGGLVETLRRTRVGPFTAEEGLTLPAEAAAVLPRLLPVSILENAEG
jgi:tRNA pseudouridine55 synthase